MFIDGGQGQKNPSYKSDSISHRSVVEWAEKP